MVMRHRRTCVRRTARSCNWRYNRSERHGSGTGMFVTYRKNGSSGRTRTYNPPVNRGNSPPTPNNSPPSSPTKHLKNPPVSSPHFGCCWRQFTDRKRTALLVLESYPLSDHFEVVMIEVVDRASPSRAGVYACASARIPVAVAFGIWNWEKLWKKCGEHGGARPASWRPGSMSAMGMLRQQSLCD